MAEPGRLLGQKPNNAGADDIDGEYEEEDSEYEHPAQANGKHTDVEGSDRDADGEEVDEDDDDEPVGAVKVAASARRRVHDSDEDAEEEQSEAGSSHSSVDSEASSVESEAENEWEGESEDDEESIGAQGSSHDCTFCGYGEEQDPSEEYEEYLTCVGCGDNAHRQCARNANTLGSDDDANNWRCLACLQHAQGVHSDNGDPEEEQPTSQPHNELSSVPKLARDLLPGHRGADPGGHSMFNDLILPDDPMDGSRSLRKRRGSHEDEGHVTRQTRKRRRSSDVGGSEAGDASAAAPTLTGGSENGSVGARPGSAHDSPRLRSARSRQPQPKRIDKRPLVWVEEEGSGLSALSLVVVFHLNNEKVQKILATKPKKKILDPRREARRERDRERRERNRQAARLLQQQAASPELPHYPLIPQHATVPLYSLAEKEMDESKAKPYGGILSEAEADTSKTYPVQADRRRFDDARVKAEEEWERKQEALAAAYETARQPKQASAVSRIKCINFGGWEIDTWHASPYPEEYSRNRVLYICEFCLKYMNSDFVAWRHKLKCPEKHPPGDEIYRDGKYSFFEVDGRKNPVYCQNLCLLAKLFLGSKTLYYDVEPFLFYVMTENDSYGCHFVGYFSKEKRSSSLNNVSCILVLPIHMRKGYGQYLIEFSYLLTRKEKKTGSPEKPLSDMGLVSYRKYWRLVLCQELLNLKGSSTSITAISDKTGMTPDDIVSGLEGLRALVRDPETGRYAFRLDYAYFKQYIEKCNATNAPKIKPECLVWTPYIMGRLGQYDDAPALQTVQQREDVEESRVEPEEGVQLMEKAKQLQNGSFTENGSAAEDAPEPITPAPLTSQQTNDGSPAPDTPFANGFTDANGSAADETIPPTRYEVYPPVPGVASTKRRAGRPFGSRRRTSTPNRARNTSLYISTAPVPRTLFPLNKNDDGKASPSINGHRTPSISLRRTRSRLGESVVNGTNGTEAPERGGGKPFNSLMRRTRSWGTGSPNSPYNPKGKGKLITEDAHNGADGDAASDLDAEGEMDVDAEGESDDMADVDMADA
ncbi:hypothetical protein M011DRAFT_456894 [Sporormia fimetaria CBS 119925]|uniref:Histone acetyltransferase n=1 Tax=Sporormia fimetaria CBS 119925 TaxID=1340428 RepID=A0A6A6VFQ1_9PLEO|nr:hypothetical protein M011DRAFT_456894 [Sporormia fimetaria CBS 119925]